jgi:thiosulfate dehydrogenase
VIRPLLLSLALGACACQGEVVHESAAERGQALFTKEASGFSCATCHAIGAHAPESSILPGAPLAGVTRRESFWGGQEAELLRALNNCRTLFQGAAPLEASETDAEDLYAYLDSLSGDPEAIPFTVVSSAVDLPEGDEPRGRKVFADACRKCHGELGSGLGRIEDDVPALPDEVLEEHQRFSEVDRRVIFIEKVRHGGFLGYSGRMPPFSSESLSDAQLSDLLTAFGLWPH